MHFHFYGSSYKRIRFSGAAHFGVGDPDVFAKARQLQAVLVTNDQGFGDVRAYPPSSHYGVIVLKMEPDPQKAQAVHRVLRELLKREQRFEHCLFVVGTSQYRKRTKP